MAITHLNAAIGFISFADFGFSSRCPEVAAFLMSPSFYAFAPINLVLFIKFPCARNRADIPEAYLVSKALAAW